MAAWIVAMLSFSSAAPYIPDMPMQPRPIAETSGPFFPKPTDLHRHYSLSGAP